MVVNDRHQQIVKSAHSSLLSLASSCGILWLASLFEAMPGILFSHALADLPLMTVKMACQALHAHKKHVVQV